MSDAGIDFGALYQEYAPILTRQLGRSVRNREDVADIVQETFVRAVRAGERFDTDLSPGPWLSTIARRLSIDAARARSTRTDVIRRALIDDVASTIEGPEQGCVDREQARAIIEAVTALPSRQQRILLRRSLGYSYEELANEEDLTVMAVKSLLNRARVAARRNYELASEDRRTVPAFVAFASALRRISLRFQRKVARAGHRVAAIASNASLSPSIAAAAVVAVAGAWSLAPAVARPSLTGAQLTSTAVPSFEGGIDNVVPYASVQPTGLHRVVVTVTPPEATRGVLQGGEVQVDAGKDHENLFRKAVTKLGPINYTGEDRIGPSCDYNEVTPTVCEVIDKIPER